MSVYGGDSWAREAQYRKRRVDDLVVEGLDASSYKKLSGGKYACLVCPHNPVFDTPLVLSMHIKGSCHCAAESKLKKKQFVIQDEINKRIALSECSTGDVSASSISTQVNQHCRLARKPLIEQTRRAASEILSNIAPQQTELKGNNDVKSSKGHSTDGPLHCNNTWLLSGNRSS
ncbi:hypothetical protein Acr_06g0015620 [Actinidia rufa]|uniref:Sodium channel modifier 1 zinc-finger domain-containing protein n=1 Tax=Actinidia rufa TaxID=165716 RepID=A0A7J0ETD9_9ERIC|nr:hypothetical protein Acr_06g0015620 [Actinidia rufa]